MRLVILTALVTAIITMIIRLTVFTTDCNLFVMGVTYVLIFSVTYGMSLMIIKLLGFRNNTDHK